MIITPELAVTNLSLITACVMKLFKSLPDNISIITYAQK